MSSINNEMSLTATSRRQMIGRVALAFGTVASGCGVLALAQEPVMKEKPSSTVNQSRTFLHQETTLKASPQRIYDALLDAKQFAAFSGAPAEIDPKAGGAFSMFGGLIVGRNVELVPNQRIVQAWRPTHWDAGVYSIVRFEMKPQGSETVVILDHTGFPEGEFDHLDWGWKNHYWEPLKKSLS